MHSVRASDATRVHQLENAVPALVPVSLLWVCIPLRRLPLCCAKSEHRLRRRQRPCASHDLRFVLLRATVCSLEAVPYVWRRARAVERQGTLGRGQRAAREDHNVAQGQEEVHWKFKNGLQQGQRQVVCNKVADCIRFSRIHSRVFSSSFCPEASFLSFRASGKKCQ
eukprot:COSAG02_NODE_5793_length_4032_cov_4.410120_4_plen_167_part_00